MKTKTAKKLTKLLIVTISITSILTFLLLVPIFKIDIPKLDMFYYGTIAFTALTLNLMIFMIVYALIWSNFEQRKIKLQNNRFFYFYNRCLTAFENNDINKVKNIYNNYFLKIKNSQEKNYTKKHLIDEIYILYKYSTTKNLEEFKFK